MRQSGDFPTSLCFYRKMYASAVHAMALCLSVSMSVCLVFLALNVLLCRRRREGLLKVVMERLIFCDHLGVSFMYCYRRR